MSCRLRQREARGQEILEIWSFLEVGLSCLVENPTPLWAHHVLLMIEVSELALDYLNEPSEKPLVLTKSTDIMKSMVVIQQLICLGISHQYQAKENSERGRMTGAILRLMLSYEQYWLFSQESPEAGQLQVDPKWGLFCQKIIFESAEGLEKDSRHSHKTS